jgi:hypothetical protein
LSNRYIFCKIIIEGFDEEPENKGSSTGISTPEWVKTCVQYEVSGVQP